MDGKCVMQTVSCKYCAQLYDHCTIMMSFTTTIQIRNGSFQLNIIQHMTVMFTKDMITVSFVLIVVLDKGPSQSSFIQ